MRSKFNFARSSKHRYIKFPMIASAIRLNKMSSFNFVRERDMAAKVCIHMEGKKTTISNPAVSGISIFFLGFT